MNDHKELTIVESRELATRVSPMDALAVMSDAEFRQRLDQMKTAQKRMETVQRELMTAEVDYGVIPGTGSKPTLLKSGAEKLAKFHHLVPTFSQQTILGDGVTAPHLRVLSICSLHAETEDGPIVGQGLGAANSWEKKHRYRDTQRLCPMCGQATIFKSKQDRGWFCWAKKGGCGVTFNVGDRSIEDQTQGQSENPDPFDGENTLEKISAKRAYVDATLRATATSGLFSQDLEDMTESEQRAVPTARTAPAKSASDAPKPATKAKPASSGTFTDEDVADLGHFLGWAYKTTGVKAVGDLLSLLGVANQLSIQAQYGGFRNAANALLKNLPPSETPAEGEHKEVAENA